MIKNNKGITIVALVIAIILILIISGMMGYYSTNAFKIEKLNNMYNDIERIQSEVDKYYIENGKLPIKQKISFNNGNINDNENYYIIDLSILGNLSLNYGSDFEKNYSDNLQDIYIINEQSQIIYYLKGIEYEGKIYYTKPIEYEKINI